MTLNSGCFAIAMSKDTCDFTQLTSLLGLATKHTKKNDMAESKKFTYSKKDFEFLQNAMNEFMSETIDVYKQIPKHIEVIVNGTDEEKIDTFNTLQDYLDICPELARNVCRVGLTDHLISCFKNDTQEVKRACCIFLALILPNNPEVQQEFYKKNFLTDILNKLAEHSEEDFSAYDDKKNEYLTRIFSVLSGLIKNQNEIEDCFLANSGEALLSKFENIAYSNCKNKIENLVEHIKYIKDRQTSESENKKCSSDKPLSLTA